MYVKATSIVKQNGPTVRARCPICGHDGTFDRLDVLDVRINYGGGYCYFGQRRCPNPECHAHIFYLQTPGGNLRTYPSLKIDFNAEKIPDNIKEALSEAIACHSEECYVAASIMVRRTLEELCEDKNASGDNLKERLKSLKDKVILPGELFSAMDELRLLGNDAAHIESKEYDNIGKEEVEVAIQLTKEILKAVYQLDSLVEKLKSFKKK